MNSPGRKHVRKALLALLASGVAAWLIPSYFSADRYRRRLEIGLERALQRPVTFRRVAIRLLPRPGFVLEDVAIQEDMAFGFEPFVRVDRIECDIRWKSLLGSRLDFSHFRLQHPNINLVRKLGAGWNVESLLLRSAAPSGTSAPATSHSQGTTSPLDFEVEDGRVNFKLGENKKAFAITDLHAQVNFDPAHDRVRFRLLGYPVRTDLSLPTPGPVEVTGEWTPGGDLRGQLNAVVRTREALLYDWAPLVMGRNPGLYGVIDSEVRISGSIRSLNFEGSGFLSDLHRWEQIPPTNHAPWTVNFRGQLDRDRKRVQLETLEASFASSHVHISGSIDYFTGFPVPDLVVALERSRLEDLSELAERLWTFRESIGIKGRVDGMLTIQGPWAQRRYGGFFGARDVVLSTRSANFPLSEVAVRIDNRGAHLAPVRITLAPRVALEAEGFLEQQTKPLQYELTFSSKAVPLRDALNFGRTLGLHALEGWDAAGSSNVSFRLVGLLHLPSRPLLTGRAELRADRLVIPGLTEPIKVSHAGVRINGDQVVIDHLQAVLGTSVLSGRLEHQGNRQSPWSFDLRADNLNLQQASAWFMVVGRQPIPLLDRLPGLDSSAATRLAASNLFSSLNARGSFATPKITYREITLSNLRTDLEVVGRVIRVDNATFKAGGGLGRLTGRMDFTGSPPRLEADVTMSGVGLQTLATHLPPVLREAHGSISVDGHLETTGLAGEDMKQNLDGHVAIVTSDLSLAGYDPIGEFVRLTGQGNLDALRGPAVFRSAKLNLQVHGGRVILKKTALESSGGKLILSGFYAFDGLVALHVEGDLRRLRRRWLTRPDEMDKDAPPRELNFSGPLDKLTLISDTEVSHVRR